MQLRQSCWRLPALLIATAFLSAVVAAVEPAAATTIATAAIARDAPDPTVAFDKTDGFYYAFTTQAMTPRGFARVPVWRSVDLVSWSYVDDALSQLPTWAAPNATTVAPSVVFAGGRWVLYFAALAANGEMCIGRATADGLSTRFRDSGVAPLTCGIGDGIGAIDPSVFVDQIGALSLLWKNEGSAQIMSQSLSSDGLRLVGSPVNVFNPDQAWMGSGVENPTMAMIGGVYYLFFSYNYWDSAYYSSGYATCLGPRGPCTGIGTVLQSTDAMTGPGGLSVFRSAANELLAAYHGWVGDVGYDHGGRRELFVGALVVGAAGPKVAESTPFGSIDVVTTSADGRARLYGWALDLDVDGPVTVHVYVDGRLVNGVAADKSRTDVARAFGVSEKHGFTVDTKPGHVCLYLIDARAGSNPLLGCRDVGVRPPTGSLDVVERNAQGTRVAGWALDPDAPERAIAVNVSVDGVVVSDIAANQSRMDVAKVYPAAGDNHGYFASVNVPSGPHEVCVSAVNTGPGGDQILGCRTIL
jgi:hypothetical protein